MKCRLFLLLIMLFGISCAKQQDTLSPDQGRDVVTRYHGAVIGDVRGTVEPSLDVVDAAPDSVWATLPGVYEELGIEPTVVDPRGFQFGNTQFVSRRIEGNRMSRYLRCGRSIGNSDNADTYQVAMSVITRVRVDEERGTVLQTEVTGSASPRHVSGNAVICTTRGRLEERIFELVSAALQSGRVR